MRARKPAPMSRIPDESLERLVRTGLDFGVPISSPEIRVEMVEAFICLIHRQWDEERRRGKPPNMYMRRAVATMHCLLQRHPNLQVKTAAIEAARAVFGRDPSDRQVESLQRTYRSKKF